MSQDQLEAVGGDILVVEDDEAMAGSLANELSHEGWNVKRAHDGESGLAAATDSSFDVLVVDRMLPRLDGFSLVSELRARGIQTPVLFLSATPWGPSPIGSRDLNAAAAIIWSSRLPLRN